ncbi:HAMP domain-containing histidine kinase [Patescibacteria group bacterium]|nr:HAMP domain-containing histidine kinase [Patescibacteria group bacterium]
MPIDPKVGPKSVTGADSAEAQTEFFLAASHQLKSPLAIVQWCLQSLLESPELATKERTLVVKALTQTNTMSHLITDMLHIFRLVNQRGRLANLVSVDLNRIIDETVEQGVELAHGAKVQVEKGPIEQLPFIPAEETYLRQALYNLIENAIKYSYPGGRVTVTAEREKDGRIGISVTDQGIGIGEADQLKLFTEFFRSEAARDHAHEGTGLGLVLVKHVIEELGGTVSVKSRLQHGSTFTIHLPVKR